MATTVYFVSDKYANYLDGYFVFNYEEWVSILKSRAKFSCDVNLGITNGILIRNNFKGNFNDINGAVVEHEQLGTHFYRIINKVFIRKNLWKLTLLKDVVSANMSNIIQSKVLVSRLGIRRDVFDPILYRKEAMELSEVKKKQLNIKSWNTDTTDDSYQPKLYGYALIWTRDSLTGQDVEVDIGLGNDDYKPDLIVNSIDVYDTSKTYLASLSGNISILVRGKQSPTITINKEAVVCACNFNAFDYGPKTTDRVLNIRTYISGQRARITPSGQIDVKIGSGNNWYTDFYRDMLQYGEDGEVSVYTETVRPLSASSMKNTTAAVALYDFFKSSVETLDENVVFDDSLFDMNGKIIQDQTTNKLYRVRVSQQPMYTMAQTMLPNMVSIITGQIKNLFNFEDTSSTVRVLVNSTTAPWTVQAVAYKINFEEIQTSSIKHTFKAFPITNDQPFKVMFIPVLENSDGTDGVYYGYRSSDGTQIGISFNRNAVIKLINELTAKYGGENAKLLDVQEVPLPPISKISTYTSEIYGTLRYLAGSANDIETLIANDTTDAIIEDNMYVIPFYAVEMCDFDYTIEMNIEMEEDIKIQEKKRYILKSPSGASSYEISIAKNKGLQGVIFKGSIRPYASWYQIQPIYEGLYGDNFLDTRGLVWKEDNSITQVSTEWATYVRQNVNYLNSFNADVEFQRSDLRINQEADWGNFGFDSAQRIVAAAIEGYQSGVSGGGLISGQINAGAAMGVSVGGQIVSEALEAGQLAYNATMDTKLLENKIAYQRQQFNYNLSNIKALPENVSKVSGIVGSNNHIPYIEIYEPTEEEIAIYDTYLDLYGVSVGSTVDLNLYNRQFNYLQGTLLKYEGVINNEEYEELCRQLTKGVRLYEEQEEQETSDV